MRIELNFDVDYTFIDMQLTPLLAFLSVTYVTANNSTRMIGGGTVRIDEFPFLVSVRLWQHDAHLCSGALILEKAVVTGSSCLHDVNASSIQVHAGRVRMLGDVATRLNVKQIIHKRDLQPHRTRNDIALLILTEWVVESLHVKSIPLQNTYDYDEGVGGAGAITFGWGRAKVSILLLLHYCFDLIFV